MLRDDEIEAFPDRLRCRIAEECFSASIPDADDAFPISEDQGLEALLDDRFI